MLATPRPSRSAPPWTDPTAPVAAGHQAFPSIEHLHPLRRALGEPTIYLECDEMLGPVPGGIQTRMREFIVADAPTHGADTLVTWGAALSNHCRHTRVATAFRPSRWAPGRSVLALPKLGRTALMVVLRAAVADRLHAHCTSFLAGALRDPIHALWRCVPDTAAQARSKERAALGQQRRDGVSRLHVRTEGVPKYHSCHPHVHYA